MHVPAAIIYFALAAPVLCHGHLCICFIFVLISGHMPWAAKLKELWSGLSDIVRLEWGDSENIFPVWHYAPWLFCPEKLQSSPMASRFFLCSVPGGQGKLFIGFMSYWWVKLIITENYLFTFDTQLKIGFPSRGVFGQQFDPLVFENFSKFTTKRAKMTVKE